MTYHLPRITNWISHHSVSHYPTHIPRQIYQPPFSEFLIMHCNVLSVGDYFSNSISLLFLMASSYVILLIVASFGLPKEFRFLSVLLALTIPEVLLQSSSTQNDVVLSFFTLSSFYFAFKAVKEPIPENFIYFGLSIGLGVLTKATAYIYLTPLIVWFGMAIIIRFVATKKLIFFKYSIIAASLFLCINSGHYTRNYQFNKTFLGTDVAESKKYTNESTSPALWLSNLAKNVGLQIAPFPINIITDKIIVKLHQMADVDINFAGTNYKNRKYQGSTNPVGEDTAPNPIHFFLAILSSLVIGTQLFKGKVQIKKPVTHLILIMFQVFLFCLFLRWQPWHTRLHTSLFLLSIPIICYAASLSETFYKGVKVIIPVAIVYAFTVVLLNTARPFISTPLTTKISILDNRYKKYFAYRIYLYNEYNWIRKKLGSTENLNIGLMLGGDQWEYPLFCQSYNKEINPIHIKVTNFTKSCPSQMKKLEYIVATTVNDTILEYNNQRFYNLSGKNKFIWLYAGQ